MSRSKLRKTLGEEGWAKYQKERQNIKALTWKIKHVEYVVNWRRRAKRELIRYKGGKCFQCGYNKDCPSAYDFHHRDPKQKDFAIGGKTKKLEKLKEEADKCDLLCRNCHAEIHEREYAPDREKAAKQFQKRIEESEQRKQELIRRSNERCICGDIFSPKDIKQKFCSGKCAKMSMRRVNRPNKNNLAKMIDKMSWCAIGRKYNVSDNAVRKWARAYGLL